MGSFLDYLSGGKKETSPTDFSSLSNYYNPDYDQRIEDNKRRVQALGGLIDGLRHLGNLTYTSQGATPMQLGSTVDAVEKKYQTDMQRKLAYDKLMREQANDIFNRNLKIAGYQATQDYRDRIAKQKEAELARQKELDKAKNKQYQQRLDLEQKKLDRLKEVDTQRQQNADRTAKQNQQRINNLKAHYKATEDIANKRAENSGGYNNRTHTIRFGEETHTLNNKQMEAVASLKNKMIGYTNEMINSPIDDFNTKTVYHRLQKELREAQTPLQIFNFMQANFDKFPEQFEEFRELVGGKTKSQNGPSSQPNDNVRNAFNTLTKD